MSLPRWLFGALVVLNGSSEAAPNPCSFRPEATETVRVGEYSVRRTRDNNGNACLQVRRGQRVEFTLRDAASYAFRNGPGESNPQITPGTDITGLGKPNLVVTEWTGGAHCCTILHVLELGPKVREIAAVDFMDTENAHFVDLDGDGVWEIKGEDWTFSYWHAAFVESPAAEVILRFDGKRYRLALERMRREPWSTAAIRQRLSAVGEQYSGTGFPPSLLWAGMLDAIYSGNGKAATDLVSGVWQRGGADKEKFVKEFCEQLASSPWFSDLRPNLAGSPCEGQKARPASRI